MQEEHIIDDLRNGRRDKVLNAIAKGLLNINQPLSTGRYPLYYAVSRSPNEELLRALLGSTDIEVNIVDEEGMTPLMWAAYFENYTALCFLIERGADPELEDKKGRKAIQMIPFLNTRLVAKARELFETRESPLMPLRIETENFTHTHSKPSWANFFWNIVLPSQEENMDDLSGMLDNQTRLSKKNQ